MRPPKRPRPVLALAAGLALLVVLALLILGVFHWPPASKLPARPSPASTVSVPSALPTFTPAPPTASPHAPGTPPADLPGRG